MKIAQITLDGFYNQGGILQRYALCEVLKVYSDTVDSLWYDNRLLLENNWKTYYPWIDKKSRNAKLLVKLVLNWKNSRNDLIKGSNYKVIHRDVLIKSFADRYINIKYNVDYEKVSEEYDCFVVGSDQVWNPNFAKLSHYMLDFAKEEQRISYAASISLDSIPEQHIEDFKRGISRMKDISVREEQGADIIQKLMGRNVDVVCDPTILIGTEKWIEIERKPYWLDDGEKYIVTYYLGKRKNDYISEVSKRFNLRIINVFGTLDEDDVVVSPEEWIYLIHHASLVYTDSFHGTVFSILFRTPFIVTSRIGLQDMSSRIDNLLKMFGLQGRWGNKDNNYLINNPLDIDFEMVDNVIVAERRRAMDYLKKALVYDELMNNMR